MLCLVKCLWTKKKIFSDLALLQSAKSFGCISTSTELKVCHSGVFCPTTPPSFRLHKQCANVAYSSTDMHPRFLPPPGALIERRLLLYKQEVHLKLKIKYLKSKRHAFESDIYFSGWTLVSKGCRWRGGYWHGVPAILHRRVNSHLASPSQQWTQQPLKLYFCTLQLDHAAADCCTSQ